MIKRVWLPSSITAISIWPYILYNKNKKISPLVVMEEKIHLRQQKQLIFILFYAWYILEWLIRLLFYFNFKKAYRNICFEREARINRSDTGYLDKMKVFGFLKYL